MAEEAIQGVGSSGTGTGTQAGSPPPAAVQGNGSSGSSAGTQNTGGEKVPFHKDPQVQDYIARQIENRMQAVLASQRSGAPEKKDELQELAVEAARDLGVDKEIAEKLVLLISKSVSKGLEQNQGIKTMRESFETQELMGRFRECATRYPDFAQYQGKMSEIWAAMPPEEKELIMRSRSGAELLYSHAKLLSGNGASNQNPHAGGSPESSSGGRQSDMTTLQSKIDTAWKNGDKKAYRELVEQMQTARR